MDTLFIILFTAGLLAYVSVGLLFAVALGTAARRGDEAMRHHFGGRHE
jgi:hypothetical protein